MEIKAKLHAKYDIEQVSPTFKKRRFVVAYAENPMYPQFVEFQLTQDKTAFLDRHEIGDTVAVHFNIEGREWRSPSGEVKYFNQLTCWKLTYADAQAPTAEPAAPYVSPSDDSDLPF
jgi:hypothetical protein